MWYALWPGRPYKCEKVEKLIQSFFAHTVNYEITKTELEILYKNFYFRYVQSISESGGGALIGTLYPNWISGYDPLECLATQEALDEIMNTISPKQFVKEVREMVVDNNFKTHLSVVPVSKKALAFEKVFEEREKKINKVIKTKQGPLEQDAQIYANYRDKKSSPQELAKFNPVPLSSLSSKSQRIGSTNKKVLGVDFVHVKNSIPLVSTVVSFDISHLLVNDIISIELQAKLLPKAVFSETSGLSKDFFRENIYNYTAGVSHVTGKDKKLRSFLTLEFAFLRKHEKTAVRAIPLILEHAKLDKKTINQELRKNISSLKESFSLGGHSAAKMYAGSFVSRQDALENDTKGIGLYLQLKANKILYMNKVASAPPLHKQGVLVHVVANSKYSEHLITQFKWRLKKVKLAERMCHKGLQNTHISNGSTVNYNSYVWPRAMSQLFNPAEKMVSDIINLEYLWPEVREKGGAYGAATRRSSRTSIGATSWRDSQVYRTYSVYDGMKKFFDKYIKTEISLLPLQVKVFGELDAPLRPRGQIFTLAHYLKTQITFNDVDAYRRKIKALKKSDLKKEAQIYFKDYKKGVKVTVGKGISGKFFKKRIKI